MGSRLFFAISFLKLSLLLLSLNACKGSFEWTSELGITSRCATEGACKMLDIDDLPESEFVYAYWGFNEIIVSEGSHSTSSYFVDEANLDRRGSFVLEGLFDEASDYLSQQDVVSGEGAANFNFSSASSSPAFITSEEEMSMFALSVSMWIKPSEFPIGSGASIISTYSDANESGWQLSYLNSNNFICLIKLESGTPTLGCSKLNPLRTGVWQHLAFTYESDNSGATKDFHVYVNGVDYTDYEYELSSEPNPVTPVPLNLGGTITIANNLGNNYPFRVLLDDLILWNKKLTHFDICNILSLQTDLETSYLCPGVIED